MELLKRVIIALASILGIFGLITSLGIEENETAVHSDRASKPRIEQVADCSIALKDAAAFDPMKGVRGYDSDGNDTTDKIQVEGNLNKEVAGEYSLTYRLKEKDVEVKKTRKITILPDETKQTEQAVQAEPAESEETVAEAAPQPNTTENQVTEAEEVISPVAPIEAAPEPAAPAPQPNASLSFLGTTIPFTASNGAAEAPASGAGTWTGTGAVNDGAPTHFIGHNPGDFSPVMNLTVGSPITVVDAAGNTRTYTVYEVLDVRDDGFNANDPADDTWFRLIDAGGERISLQTCITDTVNRVVLAQ